MENIYLIEKKNNILFGNSKVKLTFNKKTGSWTGFFDIVNGIDLFKKEEEELRPVSIYADGNWSGKDSKYISHTTEIIKDKGRLTIKARVGNWITEYSYSLKEEDDLIERKLKLTWTDSKEAILEGINFVLPRIEIGSSEDCFLIIPGYGSSPYIPLSSLEKSIEPILSEDLRGLKFRYPNFPEYLYQTQRDEIPLKLFPQLFPLDIPGPGLLAVHNSEYELAIMIWGWSETEAFYPRLIKEENKRVRITHNLLIADRFTEGKGLECGSQFIKIARGSVEKCLKSFQNWYKLLGFNVYNRNSIKTRKSAKIFQIYPYEIGFKGTIDLLSTLKEMKVNIIYLMPIWVPGLFSEKDPSFWGAYYFWSDCSRIDTKKLGREEDFRNLVDEAHKLGMKVIIDFVSQGCFVKSKLVEKHSDWFCRNKDGRMFASYDWGSWIKKETPLNAFQKLLIGLYKKYWPGWDGAGKPVGTFSFDWANEDYRDYMVKIAKHYVKEYDIDGYRIDVPGWKEYNWNPKIDYRPSHATLGGVRLLEKEREAIDRIKSETFQISEAEGPIFYRMNDLTYDYPFRNTVQLLIEGKITAKEMGQWLEYERLAFPQGAIKMRFTETHDTILQDAIYGTQNRMEVKYDIAVCRAAFALAAFIEGGLLVYHFQTEGPGAMDFYKKIISLRASIPALDYGDCDYTSVNSSDEMVFTCLRSERENYAMPIIDFRGKKTSTFLSLPFQKINLKTGKSYVLHDAYNNENIEFCVERDKKVKLDLDGYDIRVLVLKLTNQ